MAMESQVHSGFGDFDISRLHPALEPEPRFPDDIFPLAWDWIFERVEFQHFFTGPNFWQLEIVGGPGRGKTTLAILTVQHLRQLFGDGSTAPVACLFLETDVYSDEIDFIEDCLRIIYYQIRNGQGVDYCAADEQYDKFIDSRHKGKWIVTRMNLIRQALKTLLTNWPGPAFLVFDGLDHLSQSADMLLRAELSMLQEQGLRIMTCSRISLEEPEAPTCDVPDCGRLARVFWECQDCPDQLLCKPCKDKGEACPQCGITSKLIEPYKVVHFSVCIDMRFLSQYVEWELEREHGDLGLGSPNDNKPPLSALGASLREDATGDSARKLRDYVVNNSELNLSLAKLILENVHREKFLADAEALRSYDHSNIVAAYDAAIERIENQQESEKDLALRAIAAASKDFNGVPIEEITNQLARSSTGSKSMNVPFRSTQDILRASKGYLCQRPSGVICCDPVKFFNYANSDYSYALFWSNTQLPAKRQSRSRSFHMEPPDTQNLAGTQDGMVDGHGNSLRAKQRRGVVKFVDPFNISDPGNPGREAGYVYGSRSSCGHWEI